MNEKRNSEWYSDSTAYNATNNADKPRPGEIWTIDRNGVTSTVLVIAVNKSVCNILTLRDAEKAGEIPIRAKAVMYTNPCMLSYCFVSNMSEFIRGLSEDEFMPIIEAIEDALMIVMYDKDSDTHTGKAPAPTPGTGTAPASEAVVVTDPFAEAKASIYERLYNELLEKVLNHGK